VNEVTLKQVFTPLVPCHLLPSLGMFVRTFQPEVRVLFLTRHLAGPGMKVVVCVCVCVCINIYITTHMHAFMHMKDKSFHF
jgi:hypothetical protein